MSGLEPGFQLGHYRITRSLGSGGMADVYEAHDDNLERTVALKVLPVEYCRNPQLVQRFHKEVRAAAKLNHRNIVTVYEVGQQDNYHFFSMRLLTGGDLRRRIEQGLTPVESLAILRELADAFAHAHARNFVHRDVKPENVMFDEQGFPVLTDFGIAKALDANTHMTRTGMTMGTPRYLSPEQASGKPVDARADLYSLGVMFFEMLTGRPPYDAEESMAVIFKHVTEPIPTLPPDFLRYQPLLEKLMAKDPAKRVASAADLIREIDAIVPRQPTGELKQSQVRTAENPLIANLMTPSPLRTPPPQTPRPATPSPRTPAPSTAPPATVVRDVTGEVAVRVAPPAARKAVQPQPAPAPSPPAAVPAPAAPPVATPARRGLGGLLGAAAMTGGLAIAAYTSYQALTSPGARKPEPAAATLPAAAAPATPADSGQPSAADKARQDAEARARAEADARRRNEADAARQKAAQDAQAKQQADAEAQRRAQAEADAKRRAEAQAEARRRAEAEAEARRRAEAEARRRAEAEEAARRKAAEQESPQAAPELTAEEIERRAREADRRKAQAGKNAGPPQDTRAAQAEAARKKKEEEQARRAQAEEPAEEEIKTQERARRPAGF